MKYEKPEITELGRAIDAVQSAFKAGPNRDCADVLSAIECPPEE
jgi:hypothetical protein